MKLAAALVAAFRLCGGSLAAQDHRHFLYARKFAQRKFNTAS